MSVIDDKYWYSLAFFELYSVCISVFTTVSLAICGFLWVLILEISRLKWGLLSYKNDLCLKGNLREIFVVAYIHSLQEVCAVFPVQPQGGHVPVCLHLDDSYINLNFELKLIVQHSRALKALFKKKPRLFRAIFSLGVFSCVCICATESLCLKSRNQCSLDTLQVLFEMNEPMTSDCIGVPLFGKTLSWKQ